ncbi:hypothetical protein MPH_14022 [Macrophomina phaseolina MS6]|uniref:Uncharacterized protein n=1 Tax=Macrophomina phaseolina (strain MS6) TaxID=1126212 RepID=K2RX64_MACPH|nr:hypothetical protein MPH_14022 [Macrophomina phaseolina MS6]
MATDLSEVTVSLSSLSLQGFVDRYEDAEDPERWERARLRQSITHCQTTGNPFLVVSSLSTQLDEFVAETLKPNIDGKYQPSVVPEAHEYFLQAKAFCTRWEIGDQELVNFKRLLRGNLHFPALLLLNPCEDHIHPYDNMIQSPTLAYLREILELSGLELEDIVILDSFPFLTETDLAKMSVPSRRVALAEAFGLTVAFIRTFRLPALVSCQCTTNREQNEEWGYFYNSAACDLSSSTIGAENFNVKSKSFDGYRIKIIQAFHPSHILRTQDGDARNKLEQNFKEILRKVYSPCGDWERRVKAAIELHKIRKRL